MESFPFVSDVLELYTTTPEGLQLWKPKGVEIASKNLLANIFILSTDLSSYFNIKHNDLFRRNISKLIKEKYLPDHLRIFAQMVDIGSSAKRIQTVFAFTRHQTERLIMDFSGPKARRKKFEILMRLQSIEENVLAGDYTQARQKVTSWNGVQLLTDLGFTPSLPNQMATKKDIATFLQMPESSLTTFLARHRDQIQATKLTKQQIQALGKKSNRLNAYTQDDVFKIAFWMDTEIGKKLKQQIFGDLGVYSTPGTKEEVEWKIILSKMFAGLGFQYQYHIGDYIVDFWVEKLALVLECDRDNHRYYNKTEETRRDKYLTQHYSLIRFNSHISIELLVNAILKIQPKQLVKLYLPLDANKDADK